jgi:hypothetical protein
MDISQSVDSGDKALIILQSLVCYLREKNILSRCDIEELCERVEGTHPVRTAATDGLLGVLASYLPRKASTPS